MTLREAIETVPETQMIKCENCNADVTNDLRFNVQAIDESVPFDVTAVLCGPCVNKLFQNPLSCGFFFKGKEL